jgi:hypothetical protein
MSARRPPPELGKTVVIQQTKFPSGAPAAKGVDVKPPPRWNYEPAERAPATPTKTEPAPPPPEKASPPAEAKPPALSDAAIEEQVQDLLLAIEATAAFEELQKQVAMLEELIDRLPT